MKKTDKILAEIKKANGVFASMKQTESKTPIIKTLLFDILKDVRENAPLPSIRSISNALGTAILPVHKAITELKNEGIIISKSTSGFIKAPSPSTSSTDTSTADSYSSVFGVNNINLKLMVESIQPYQRSFWQDIINSKCFHAKNPFINIEMIFENFDNVSDYCGIDIAEMCSHTYLKHKLEDKFLNIKNYFDVGYAPKQAELFANQLTVPYSQTFFVFYNSDFVNKNNLPEPEFKNFEEQKRYFEYFSAKAKDFDIDYFMGSTISPIVFIERCIEELMDSLVQKPKSPDKELYFEKLFNQVIEFCSLFNYKSSTSEHMRFYFDNGTMPLFIGNSTVYWQLLSQNLNFKWKAYPLFSVDNSCIRFPIYTGILKSTNDPLNAFQIILFLFEHDVQKKFANIGFVPSDPDMFEIESLTKDQNTFFKDAFKKSALPNMPDYFQFYIQNSIFSPRLLEKAMNYQTKNYDFKKLFRLASTYFASQNLTDDEYLVKDVI